MAGGNFWTSEETRRFDRWRLRSDKHGTLILQVEVETTSWRLPFREAASRRRHFRDARVEDLLVSSAAGLAGLFKAEPAQPEGV